MKRLFATSLVAAAIVWFGQWVMGLLEEASDDMWEWETEDDPDANSTLQEWTEWWGYEDDN